MNLDETQADNLCKVSRAEGNEGFSHDLIFYSAAAVIAATLLLVHFIQFII